MATIISNKIQIAGTVLSQTKELSKLLKSNPKHRVSPGSSYEPRNFWSWIKKKKSKSKENRVQSVCGQRLPERLEPSNPECESKCLQIKKCKDNESAMRKLTNCRETTEVKVAKEKISYWEGIFGSFTMKKKLPDPSTCHVLQCKKKMTREKDPRLRDPRYKMTAGDAFIFTERPKTKICKPREPLPKSPPSHKLPRAVFTQNFVRRAGTVPNTCAAAWQFESSCDTRTPKCSSPKAPILPFEELRPPNKRRTKFSCKMRSQTEIISYPKRNDSDCCDTTKFQSQRTKNSNSANKNITINDPNEFFFEINNVRGKSRLEQLKKLTRAKEVYESSELLANVAQDNSNRCPPSSK